MKQTKMKSLNLRKAVGAVALTAMMFGITGTGLAATYTANQKAVGGDMQTDDWNAVDDALAGLQYTGAADGWGFNVAPSSGVGVTTDQIVVTGDGAQITGNSSVTGTFDVDGAATATSYTSDAAIEATTTITAGTGLTVTSGGATITAGGLTVSAGTTTLTPLAAVATHTELLTTSDAGVVGHLANGTADQMLVMNGAGTGLAWATAFSNSLTDGDIFVGNGSNVATGVTMSGDATIDNTGALTIATGSVEDSMIEGLASGAFIIGVDGTAANNAKVTMSGEAAMANTGAVTLDNGAVIGKVLTGYTAGAGTVAATDSILQAIQKLDGNATGYVPYTGASSAVDLGSQNLTTTGTTSTGALTATGTVTLGSGTGILVVTAGVVSVDNTPLDVANGGTGVTTFGGDTTILYTTAADTLTSLAKGTGGQVLKMNSGATGLEWGDATATEIELTAGADSADNSAVDNPATACTSANVGAISYVEDATSNEGSFWGCSRTGASTYVWTALSIFNE